jgi:hypothetical protein
MKTTLIPTKTTPHRSEATLAIEIIAEPVDLVKLSQWGNPISTP